MLDLTKVSEIIKTLSSISPEKLTSQHDIRIKLAKIKLQASMPVCSEQLLRILFEILSLKNDLNVEKIGNLKIDAQLIDHLVEHILPLLEQEQNSELHGKFKDIIGKFKLASNNDPVDLFREFKNVFEMNVSRVDMDYVMEGATKARRIRETVNKNAIVMLGKTGAGKSFIANLLGYAEMFTRNFWGKLVTDTSKQPDFLKHIVISDGVVSQTTELGFIEIDKMRSKGIEKFYNKRYLLSDTPGTSDNHELGAENRLTNILNTIAPFYRSNSVRFLVVLSAGATSERGNALRETIQNTAKMFASVEDLTAVATDSMVFAISGQNASAGNNPEFVKQLDNFVKSRDTLRLNDKDIALIEIMKHKFANNKVLIIAPGTKGSATPESIMQALDECKPAKPTLLTPYAEARDMREVDLEATFVSKSIKQIIGSLGSSLPDAVMKSQMARLTTKFATLSFMNTYYRVNKSNIVDYFTEVATLMNHLKKVAGDGLYPANGVIDVAKAEDAIAALSLLQELDQMVRVLANGVFSDRAHVLALIKAFNPNIVEPVDFKGMDEREWSMWVMQNAPKPFAKDAQEKIKEYRITQITRLNGLLTLQVNELRQQQAERLLGLPTVNQNPVERAQTSALQANSNAYQACVRQAFPDSVKNRGFELSTHSAKLKMRNIADLNAFAINESNSMEVLVNVIGNLQIQDKYFSEFFVADNLAVSRAATTTIASVATSSTSSAAMMLPPPASAPMQTTDAYPDLTPDRAYSPNILADRFDRAKRELSECVKGALLSRDYLLALNAIAIVKKLQQKFGHAPDETVQQLHAFFRASFAMLVEETNVILTNGMQLALSAEDAQQLILNTNLINLAKNHADFAESIKDPIKVQTNDNDANTVSYPTLLNPPRLEDVAFNLQQRLEVLATNLQQRSTELKSSVETLCKQQYTEGTFTKIAGLLQQAWYLLSLNPDNHAELVADYTETVTLVSAYCQSISAVFVDQLQVQASVGGQVDYVGMNRYLELLKTEQWVQVLKLEEEAKLKAALNDQVSRLTQKLNQADLSISAQDVLTSNEPVVAELTLISEKFPNVLAADYIEKIKQAFQHYNNRLVAALTGIATELTRLSTDASPLPTDFLVNAERYLNQCKQLGVHAEQEAKLRTDITDYVVGFTARQNAANERCLAAVMPSAAGAELKVDVVASAITQYAALQKASPTLYATCGAPITTWIANVNMLVAEYGSALATSLKAATLGDPSDHDRLMKCVVQLQKLDENIKAYPQSQTKPVIFEKLHKRFTKAFDSEFYPKIRDVMRAVFKGDFELAQQLSTDDETFKDGTDMRKVLVEQIGFYISASTATIERAIVQMRTNPVAKPAYMDELMASVDRVRSAQTLVEASLLSEKLLTKRDQLLIDTQSALDAWLRAVATQIGAKLNKLEFKAASQQFFELQTALAGMKEMMPHHVDTVMAQLQTVFKRTAEQCVQEYSKPSLSQLESNPHTFAQVAAGFIEAKDVTVGETEFAVCWATVSERVYATIDATCREIEEKFSSNDMSLTDALSTLERVQALMLGADIVAADLFVKVKARYVKTVEQIEKDNLANKEGEERLKNIQSMLASSAKFAKTLGSIDPSRANDFVANLATSLRKAILDGINQDTYPVKQLVVFADLHKRFHKNFSFLQQDLATYAGLIEGKIKIALANIKSSKSRYSSSSDANQVDALQEIATSLARLVEIQHVETATKGMAGLVDANLHNQVVAVLLDFKDLLFANNEKFMTALKGRNVNDLAQVLVVAKKFEQITMGIEQYINACNISPLPENFKDLKQLNNDYSYVEFRNKLIDELKVIRDGLLALDPKALKAEGRVLREAFYTKLKRDMVFIQNMPALAEHLDATVLEKTVMASDFGLEQCLTAVAAFLSATYRLADNQLKTTTVPTITSDWVDFNRYYQELMLFVDQCGGTACLDHLRIPKKQLSGSDDTAQPQPASSMLGGAVSSMMSYLPGLGVSATSATLDGNVDAPVVAQYLVIAFNDYLNNNVIDSFMKKYFGATDLADVDEAVVSLLAGLQKMAEDMPVLGANIRVAIKKLLAEVQAKRDEKYMVFLAELLRVEERGFGARLVNEQVVFAGIMTAARNKLTLSQDIDYVLKNMQVQDKGNGLVRDLTPRESAGLRDKYVEFDARYTELITEYTSQTKNFAKFGETHLEELRAKILRLVADNKPDRDADGHIIWNEKVTNLLPQLYAYLFTIWTLKESSGFFDAVNTDASQTYLKKPHPAQMVAIFQMLNVLDAKREGLPSHLDELLTGQGKSVVLASTASAVTLLGFAAEVGCYSEYLSSRDAKGFEWMIDFLGVKDFVQYGTFNRLCEDMLNQQGDLRHLMSNALFGTTHVVTPKKSHGRQVIGLVDEVDSLVSAFFGFMYQPYFLLDDQKILALQDAIWNRHIATGTVMSFRDLSKLPEYTACLGTFKGREYIIQNAAREMLADLKKYKREQGHDFHVNPKGEIYYKHFDGTTLSKSIGYQTYWACRDKANNVSEACCKKHRGLKVTCGAYSYADLMRDHSRYRVILGATGTYRELSPVEKKVVKDVFGITGASFIPSVYGKNILKFNKGVDFEVVPDDEYDIKLVNTIRKRQRGTSDLNDPTPIRPVLVFFETEAELERFSKSDAFKDYKKSVLMMMSNTITTSTERDTLITLATRTAQTTLAMSEHGRGSDFILSSNKAIMNGGMAVVDANMPETEAEQRQHQGRAARQDQDGSYCMVIRESELIAKYGFTPASIAAARDKGELYKTVSDARNKKFADGFQKIVDESVDILEKIHLPSMKLLEMARNPKCNRDELAKAHQMTLTGTVDDKVAVAIDRHAKLLILFDSTGSMGDLIEALKTTLQQVVSDLREVLAKENCSFDLQIAHYEDYDSGPGKELRTTTQWSSDPEYLNKFISAVMANGGGGNGQEAVELALWFANWLAAQEGVQLDHVVLIGDEPPSSQDGMKNLRAKHAHGARSRAFMEAQHYLDESRELAKKKVPVSTFFTRTSTFNNLKGPNGEFLTQRAFADIANITGGEAGELNLKDPKTAATAVTGLFARKIINAVAKDDKDLAENLLAKFNKRMDQRSS